MFRRLFFALPAQSLASKLHHCQRRLRAEHHQKPVCADNFHLTLHFLGLQDESLLPLLYQAAAQIHLAPFEILLDQYGLFRRARCLWLGPQQSPRPLHELVTRLGEELKALDLQISDDYHPHITLFRNAHGMTQLTAPVLRLAVSEFVLYESVSTIDGVLYKPLQRWLLQEQFGEQKPK